MKQNVMRLGVALVVVIMLGMAAGCGYQAPAPATPAVDLAAEEKAIRTAAAEWGAAIKARDLEKTLSFYAAEATILPPSMMRASTPEQRRKTWEAFYKDPAELASIETTDITLSHHGDLAYETGQFTQSVKDKKGKTSTVVGKYLVVWKKQADGKWKAVVDTWNMDS